MYIPPLAKVWQRCSIWPFSEVTDNSKTAMCWSHHFSDSPDDEKYPVFCSYYTFVSPCFYFHHHYCIIPLSFFPLKPDIFTLSTHLQQWKHRMQLNMHTYYITLDTLVLFNTWITGISSFKAASENFIFILSETSNYLNVQQNIKGYQTMVHLRRVCI